MRETEKDSKLSTVEITKRLVVESDISQSHQIILNTNDNAHPVIINGSNFISDASNNVGFGTHSLRTTTNYGSIVNDYGENNIAFGNSTLKDTSGTNNIAFGHNAGNLVTTGGYNTLVGGYAGNTITTGNYNTCIGYNSDVSGSTSSYNIRFGHYGLVKYFAGVITLDNCYTSPADGDAAHTNALFTIPGHSFIRRIVVTVNTLGAGTHTFMVVHASSTTVSSGAATSGTELLGATEGTGVQVTSSLTKNAPSDIVASSGGTVHSTWIADISSATDNSIGWIGTSDRGIYIAHAGSNSTSSATNPVLEITVEYYGPSV